MTKAEFEKLVTEYGRASFECGSWRGGIAMIELYQELEGKETAAKQAVLDAFEENAK